MGFTTGLGLHSRATRLCEGALVERPRRVPTGFSPSTTPLSRGLGHVPPQRTPLQTTIRRPRVADSHAGLFPLRSPLLGESWLVSFPPPTDMLKLSGWSRLNSCPIAFRVVEERRCAPQAEREASTARGRPTSPPGARVGARRALCAAADPVQQTGTARSTPSRRWE